MGRRILGGVGESGRRGRKVGTKNHPYPELSRRFGKAAIVGGVMKVAASDKTLETIFGK